MVNRCESGLPPGSPRNSKAPGMGHGSWVYGGHWAWRARGHEGTWTLLGPLQSTDALAVGNLSSPSNIMGRNNPINREIWGLRPAVSLDDSLTRLERLAVA